jgi:hypothetical protein
MLASREKSDDDAIVAATAQDEEIAEAARIQCWVVWQILQRHAMVA